jgi:hypothetical protein
MKGFIWGFEGFLLLSVVRDRLKRKGSITSVFVTCEPKHWAFFFSLKQNGLKLLSPAKVNQKSFSFLSP